MSAVTRTLLKLAQKKPPAVISLYRKFRSLGIFSITGVINVSSDVYREHWNQQLKPFLQGFFSFSLSFLLKIYHSAPETIFHLKKRDKLYHDVHDHDERKLKFGMVLPIHVNRLLTYKYIVKREKK